MLANEDIVNAAETMLRSSGQLEEFIASNGPIVERMILAEGSTPEGSDIAVEEGDIVFKGSFEDLDCAIGIVFDPRNRVPKSGMWVERLSENAKPPTEDAVNLFAARIMSSILEDGSVHLPVISFIAGNGRDLTIVGFGG